jgi:hypothetical protein
MSKQGSLVDALRKEDLKPAKAEGHDTGFKQASRYVSPCRSGKKSLTVWFEADVIKQLKMIGLQEGMTIQCMTGEALNDFFSKHNKSRIAR